MRNLLPSFLLLSAAFQAVEAQHSGASAVNSLAQNAVHTVEKELHSYFKKKGHLKLNYVSCPQIEN